VNQTDSQLLYSETDYKDMIDVMRTENSDFKLSNSADIHARVGSNI